MATSRAAGEPTLQFVALLMPWLSSLRKAVDAELDGSPIDAASPSAPE